MASFNRDMFLVLFSISAGPTYGYAIRKHVQKLTGGKITLSLAAIYDSLHTLLHEGFVARVDDVEIEGRPRRHYGITRTGSNTLESEKERRTRESEDLGLTFVIA